MNKNLMSLAIASVLGLGVTSALADDAFQGSWYLAPGVSYMNTDSDLEADNDIGGFLRLGKELSEHWDVQIGLGHAEADEDTGIVGMGGKYKQTLLGVDALYMFSRDKFRPFLLAGLGVARNDIDYDYNGVNVGDDKTSWMANVGLGAQYFFNETIGLQADLRHVWSRADVSSEAKAAGYSDPGTIGNTYFNLGGIIKFGAPKQVVAEAPAPEPVIVPPAPVVEAPAPAPVCKPTFQSVTISAEKLFGFDMANLNDNGVQELNAVAEQLKKHDDIEVILVTGHTDRIGSDEYNQKLSERRANVVKEYLVSQGVDESRLQAVGKGESEPVVACEGVRGKAAIECLAPNRRVVVEATHKEETGCVKQ